MIVMAGPPLVTKKSIKVTSSQVTKTYLVKSDLFDDLLVKNYKSQLAISCHYVDHSSEKYIIASVI